MNESLSRRMRTVFPVLLAMSVIGGGAGAQQPAIRCVAPVNCSSSSGLAQELLSVDVVTSAGAPAGQDVVVYFRASNGKPMIDSAKTDKNGRATLAWRADGANRSSTIQVDALVAGAPAHKEIHIAIAPVLSAVNGTSDPAWYSRRGFWSQDPQWYENHQLRHPAIVSLNVPLAQCTTTAVLFRSFGKGAEAAPDTAFGELTKGGAPCEARGYWTVGSGGTRQILRASLLADPDQRVDFHAKSRAVPWLGVGLAVTGSSKYLAQISEDRVNRVTRRFQVGSGNDSLEFSFDSTSTATRPDSVAGKTQLAPVIGVNFPLILRAEWFRMYLGADLKTPRSDWYAGFSLLQMVAGWQQESVGYDLDIVAHVSQRHVITNPECFTAPATCNAETRTRMVGWGALLSLNTAPVLDKLFSALGVK